MATSGFANLSGGDTSDSDGSELDFSDLHEQFQVRLKEGLDTFIVIDGLPIVEDANVEKLKKFIQRKIKGVGVDLANTGNGPVTPANAKSDHHHNHHHLTTAIHMPMDETGEKSLGFAFVECSTAKGAMTCIRQLHNTPLDRKHRILVNKLTDIEHYGAGVGFDGEFRPPVIEPYKERGHLKWWLSDTEARDQFAIFRAETVSVYWNEREEAAELILERFKWTEPFIKWSPFGTYFTSVHQRGAQLWCGEAWDRHKRFAHPYVDMVDFSPDEKYLTTWSRWPITIDGHGPSGGLSYDEDGKHCIVWSTVTGKVIRSFANPENFTGDERSGKLMPWPAMKWSSDSQYVARMTYGQCISVYELPRMTLLGKSAIKIDGVQDFEWAPATIQREGIKEYEQLLCFWTPEMGSNPAKVALMSIPSKQIIRTLNLFNVSDVRLHWQSLATYVCVKVDRHSKSRKSLVTNLEIFRVQEKGVPVEVVDTIKDTVINFAWEPKGDRFVIITANELPGHASGGGGGGSGAVGSLKTSVSFFCRERSKVTGSGKGNFRHIRTVEKKSCNAIYWSPRGRFVLIASVHPQQSFSMDFWDMDFEGEKDEKDKDLMANLQLMNTAEHYGVTDAEWDPTGRYVVTLSSVWKHEVESGYHLHDFKGSLLREEFIPGLKQFLWRPRPPSLLSVEEQKKIRRTLREYSKIFDPQDQSRRNKATRAIIEHRKNQLESWTQWREKAVAQMVHDMQEMGLPPVEELEEVMNEAMLANLSRKVIEKPSVREPGEGPERLESIEEIVEEIVEESEEVIP